MLLANDKTLQELENREISVIDCISNKAVLVIHKKAAGRTQDDVDQRDKGDCR